MGEVERRAQPVRIVGAGAAVERGLRAGLIGAPVEDQLAVSVAEVPELEPALAAAEEGVVLRDVLPSGVRQSGDSRQKGVDAVEGGLDLDVARHRPIQPAAPSGRLRTNG
jgi:hypothetical protein